jgi:hypothetical protein
MSLATLERAILDEARTVTGRPKLRKKDLLAWSTGPLPYEAGETPAFLPALQVHVILPAEAKKEKR